MSRLEQDLIQSKLKTAIQNHQMLVVKLKNDNQNLDFKKKMVELQEEIKRLSEEHKKMVVKVRENLVRSISQNSSEPVAPNAAVGNVGQAITAIGQPRLVSFPTQGGATILPMGMVAVPIAHMQQKSAVGMALHPPGMTALTQAANISIIPTGFISNFATINGGGSLTLNTVGSNMASLCGAVAQSFPSSGPVSLGNNTVVSVAAPGAVILNSCPPAAGSSSVSTNTSSSAGRVVTTPAMTGLPNSSSSINLNNFTNMTSLIINNSIGSNHPLVINSNINNRTLTTSASTTSNTNGAGSNNLCTVAPSSTPSVCSGSSSSGSGGGTSSCGGASFLMCPVPALSTPTSGVGAPSLVLSSFPQQPLVQPQLLQQQQQQIIQLIQQQQNPAQLQHTLAPPPLPPPPPPPPQRLASHLPIKVPQYTASCNRPAVSTVLAQHNSNAPSLTAPLVSKTKMSTTTSTSTVKASAAVVHKIPSVSPALLKSPSLTNGSHLGKELKDVQVKSGIVKQARQVQQKYPKDGKTKSLPVSKDKSTAELEVKPLCVENNDKIQYMQALGLYTPEAVREIMIKRGERKRRTTANPNYRFGFEISRADRTGGVLASIPIKKARTNKVKGDESERSWPAASNSTPHHWSSTKSSRQSDNHDDYCAACSKGGSLLMCSTCRLVYHLDCLNPPLTEAPQYAWSCPQCLVSGKGLANLSTEARKRVNSYIAKKADKEDEWKKCQRKSREIKAEKGCLERRLQEVNTKIQEQRHLQTKLSKQEQKIQEDLNKLSGFVNMIRESRSVEHVAASLVQANCS